MEEEKRNNQKPKTRTKKMTEGETLEDKDK
jgi:hypothetical protein